MYEILIGVFIFLAVMVVFISVACYFQNKSIIYCKMIINNREEHIDKLKDNLIETSIEASSLANDNLNLVDRIRDIKCSFYITIVYDIRKEVKRVFYYGDDFKIAADTGDQVKDVLNSEDSRELYEFEVYELSSKYPNGKKVCWSKSDIAFKNSDFHCTC